MNEPIDFDEEIAYQCGRLSGVGSAYTDDEERLTFETIGRRAGHFPIAVAILYCVTLRNGDSFAQRAASGGQLPAPVFDRSVIEEAFGGYEAGKTFLVDRLSLLGQLESLERKRFPRICNRPKPCFARVASGFLRPPRPALE